ncbi:FAD:protein FMN transferase [Limosilactobacillus gastricus]|uniref:FAD:protein FMN transferase n=1 Tax=Limosilactobacillus gastricus TaxID=227942 RepID=UPI0026EFE6BA|nr:FAD:protein FMN transferase [Limosilactobacillus gastricus]
MIKSQVIEMMTIPFTVSLAASNEDVLNETFALIMKPIRQRLAQVEQNYSAFRADSLVCRFQNGEDQLLIENPEFQHIYAATKEAQLQTEGYFDPMFNGKYDPTGYVKGWAIEMIFKAYLRPLLVDPRIDGVCLNGGGDLQVASRSDRDFTWHIGIENPQDLQNLVGAYAITNGAVASSGISKRGHHIKVYGEADLLQASIIDQNLIVADVWATAGIAAGWDHFKELIKAHQLSGMAVTKSKIIEFDCGVMTNA